MSHLSPSRGPHPGPEVPALQRDAVSAAEGGAGQDKEEAAGQRRPLHLGDGRGQVHAALLPHRLLALLWEAQWRFVIGAENINNNRVKQLSLIFKGSYLEELAWWVYISIHYSLRITFSYLTNTTQILKLKVHWWTKINMLVSILAGRWSSRQQWTCISELFSVSVK